MLDIHLFRNNPELIRESQRKRFEDEEIVGEVIRHHEVLRTRQFELDELRRNNNLTNKQIAKLKIAGKDVDAALLIQDTEDVKRSTVEKDAEVQETRVVLDSKIETVGNLVHDSVPVSNDEADNVVVRTWGKKRTDSKLKNHVELVEDLGIADFREGANVAGGRGYFLKGDGFELNQALIQFGLDFLKKRGYTPIQTPFIMTQNAMKKCAQLAQYDDELYKVPSEREDKYLIATAEQPLCAYHMDKRFDSASLPIRYAGFSTCFRKEAGAHGKDTRGLFRLHQFEKIEQFCITSPHDNKSWEMHEEMIKNAEEFYQLLKLPYQVVSIVSGALNDAAAKKYDLEAWFPASNTYRELVSCSNCTDYQSRKLGLRFVDKKGNEAKKEYCHILNSTLTATERTICCILENYQTKDGVEIPEVLRPFMGGRRFMFNKIYKPEEEESTPKTMDMFGMWLLEAFTRFNLLFEKIKGLF